MSASAKRVAAVDFGTVRIGVAIADLELRIATPLEVVRRRGADLDAAHFRALATRERIELWVVGLPVHLDGRESQKSAQAREFGHWLHDVTQVPVVFFDERFTTSQAHAALVSTGMSARKRREKLDMLAAQALLAAYLESCREGEGIEPLDA